MVIINKIHNGHVNDAVVDNRVLVGVSAGKQKTMATNGKDTDTRTNNSEDDVRPTVLPSDELPDVTKTAAGFKKMLRESDLDNVSEGKDNADKGVGTKTVFAVLAARKHISFNRDGDHGYWKVLEKREWQRIRLIFQVYDYVFAVFLMIICLILVQFSLVGHMLCRGKFSKH